MLGRHPLAGILGFPPPSKDRFTQFLLRANGNDADATSASIIDVSPNRLAITIGNQAQVDFGQSKFPSGSILFDGVDDSLRPASHAGFSFGTGDFTFECWLRANTAVNSFLFMYPAADTGLAYNNPGGTMRWVIAGSSILETAAISTGTWNHVAVTRRGSLNKIFLNGANGTTTDVTNTTDYGSTAIQPWIGIGRAGTFDFDGWIAEMRVSKGISRYNAPFVPQTQQFQ